MAMIGIHPLVIPGRALSGASLESIHPPSPLHNRFRIRAARAGMTS
jgi:hypothetical protein